MSFGDWISMCRPDKRACGTVALVLVSLSCAALAQTSQTAARTEGHSLEQEQESDRADDARLDSLLSVLRDENGDRRLAAKKALVSLGPKAVGKLIRCLYDPNAYVRSEAAVALVEIGAPAVSQLAEVIRSTRRQDPPFTYLDPAGLAHHEAFEGLGQIRDPAALDILISLLNDSSGEVRLAAVEALGHIKSPASVPALVELLRRATSSDPTDADLADAAARALGAVADPRATIPLIESLGVRFNDSYLDFRAHHSEVTALEKIGPEAVEPLISALKQKDPNVRQGAAAALAAIGDRRGDAALMASLKVVAQSYVFLIRHGADKSEPILVKALFKFGGKTMAQDFANCGNEQLEAAAGQWASLHGYRIIGYAGGPGGAAAWGRW